MRVGIMQPYFVPYMGYFHLINAVDLFILLDDVEWSKGGWVNRNRILVNGKPKFLTLPIQRPGLHAQIRDIELGEPLETVRQRVSGQVVGAYRKAPRGKEVERLIASCMSEDLQKVSEINAASLRICGDLLGIEVAWGVASELDPNPSLTGVARVLGLIELSGGTHYINLPGGRGLYDGERFAANGIDLAFVEPELRPYPQFDSSFVPGLSVLDVVAFCSPSEVREQAKLYRLES